MSRPPEASETPRAVDSLWYASVGYRIASEEIALLMATRGGSWSSPMVARSTGFSNRLVAIEHLPYLRKHGIIEGTGYDIAGKRQGPPPRLYNLTPKGSELFTTHAYSKGLRIARALDMLVETEPEEIPPVMTRSAEVAFYEHATTATQEEICLAVASGDTQVGSIAEATGFRVGKVRPNLQKLVEAETLTIEGTTKAKNYRDVLAYGFPESVQELLVSHLMRKTELFQMVTS